MPRHSLVSRSLIAAVLAAGLVAAGPVLSAEGAAATLSAGDPFPVLDLEDQFGEARPVPGEASLVVFSGSKSADDALAETLGEAAGDALRAGEVIYLSDISRMPGLITRLIAMPALKDRDYPVTLIREDGLAGRLPARDGCYTLFYLSEEGDVEDIEEICEPATLSAALKTDSTAP
jgi:hypothetical protein